jgi:RNA polymerase sigma-70 factor (ECF subfamily)
MRIEAITEMENPSIYSSEEIYLQNEMQEHIDQTIDGLPHRCKLIFLLSRFEALSYKEISVQLDISPKTVENQISKALKIIRKALQKYSESPLLIIVFIFLLN